MEYIIKIETSPEDEKALAHVYRTGGAPFAFNSVAQSVVNSARDQLVRFEREAAASEGRQLTGDDNAIILAATAPDAEMRHTQMLAKLAAEQAEREAAAKNGPLTARQLRLGLVNNGFALAQVSAAIDALPDGADKEKARIEWEFAAVFERAHPLIAVVAAALGISAEQIDVMWREAHSL